MFRTKYGEPLTRILNAYPPGPGLVAALEALVETAIQSARSAMRDEIAATVCEGLHDGKPSGLVCGRCHTAEKTVHEALFLGANKVDVQS